MRAEPTPARTVQFSLLDPAQPSPERLAETMARLHEWTAAGRAGAPALARHAPAGRVRDGDVRPGPGGGATAAVATGPPGPRLALRAFRPPLPAQVALRDGAPGVRGRRQACAGRWWTAPGPGARPATGGTWPGAARSGTWRSPAGGLYRIFRDRLRDEWFVEGELD